MGITFHQPHYTGPTSTYTSRDLASVTDFIIHHSAGPTDQTPEQIEAFEIGRGDIGIPYTWLISEVSPGTVEFYIGRPPYAISAASYGRNAQSVAVCVIGNFQARDPGFTGTPSAAIIDALVQLRVFAQRAIPSLVRTIGHRDVATMFYPNDTSDYATACPGDTLYSAIPIIRLKAGAILNNHQTGL